MPHASDDALVTPAGSYEIDLIDVSLSELRSTGDSALAEAVSRAVSEAVASDEVAARFNNKF